MKTSADLEQMLRDIDRKSYPAYKTLKGSYRFHTYILSIDHVQGDPFASPSRLTIRIDGKAAGFSDTPLAHAVPFKSPASLSVTIPLPHRGSVNGMGIRCGITLITGGYHGKSTLLKALEAGVYNHIAGDGREFVMTDASAVKLRAEEGRSHPVRKRTSRLSAFPVHGKQEKTGTAPTSAR